MTILRISVCVLVFLIGNSVLALTNGFNSPAVGWNPYYYWFSVNNATLITNGSRFVHTNGVQDTWASVGADFYINIGAHWSDKTTNSLGAPNPDATKFPDGIGPLVTYIHSLGLKAGIACQGEKIGSDTEYDEGIAGYWTNSVNQFAAWGIDYINFDFCNGVTVNGHTYTAQEQAAVMAGAVLQASRPMRLEIVTIVSSVPGAWTPGVANSARVSLDTDATFANVLSRADAYNTYVGITTNGYWNDADDLQIAVLNPQLTATQDITQYGLWIVQGGPLMWSNSMTNMSAWTLALALNTELAAIHQDKVYRPGTRISRIIGTGGNMDGYAKPITNGMAVALVNGTAVSTNITVNWDDVGLKDKPAQIRDVVNHAYVGFSSSSYTASLPSGGIAVLTLVTNFSSMTVGTFNAGTVNIR